MLIEVRSSFERDTKKLSPEIKGEISDAIMLIQNATLFSEIPGVKDLKGGKKAQYAYRMRIGNFRICFYYQNNVVELVRVLPRKMFIKFFLKLNNLGCWASGSLIFDAFI